MTELKEIYKCEVCGNIVEIVHSGAGQLVCCNQNMTKLEEKTLDELKEKHVPVIEKIDEDIYRVNIGSIPHPSTTDHHIEWIEIIADNKIYRKHLEPLDKPTAIFKITAKKISARAYCNLHGLWKSEEQ
jgi:superoxide reductase